jgi:hypothetical protein
MSLARNDDLPVGTMKIGICPLTRAPALRMTSDG